MEQGIATRHPLQPLFKPRLAADPLNVAMHHDRAVLPLGPAEGHGISMNSKHINGVGIVSKTLQFGRSLNTEALITQGPHKSLEIGKDSRQDGEMGHGPDPALTDPSHNDRADQDPLQLGVMASGNGSNFEAMAQAIQAGDLRARILRLVVNNPGCGAQQRAERLGIPVSILDHRVLKDRRELDTELVRLFRSDQVEVVVMAGWMRIVTDVLIGGYAGRLINIHPSLLPKYTGLNTHQRALEAGDPVHGTSVHFVTEELDGGPVIAQAEVKVSPEDTPESLAEKVKAKEHILYPIVVRWFCEGRIQLGSDYILFDGELLKAPLRLTDD